MRTRWTTKVRANGNGQLIQKQVEEGVLSRRVALRVQGRWSGQEGTDNTQRERGERLAFLPLVGCRVRAEIQRRRTGGQWGTVGVWPGAQDQCLQAAHIQALSLSSLICT